MEANVCSSMASDTVTVKKEPIWEQVTGSHSVSEAAALAGLYTDHEVKEELVIGPVMLQPPGAVFTGHWDHTYAKTENPKGDVHVKEEVVECLKEEAEWEVLAVREQPVLRDCVVRLERSDSLEAPLRTNTCRGMRHVDNSAHVGSQIHRETSIVTEKENYVCDICEKRFSMKTQLMEHIMIHIHQRMKQQESKAGNAAAGAGAGRGQRGGRGEGRGPTRAGEYRYCCETCLHKFPTPSTLKRHERTHTGERPFSCGTCKRKFAESSNLKRHERTHAGERPFSCGICQNKFANITNLKSHEGIHTGEKLFSCEICKQKFAWLSSLKRHERTHTGERPYSCGICKQKFAWLSSLKNHEQTHTRVKPYTCNVCMSKSVYAYKKFKEAQRSAPRRPDTFSNTSEAFSLAKMFSYGRITDV